MKLFSAEKSPTEVEITTRQLSQLSALVHEETKKLNQLRDTIYSTKNALDNWERTEKERITREIEELKNEVASLEARKRDALAPTEYRELEVAKREEEIEKKLCTIREREKQIKANLAFTTRKDSELTAKEQELTVEGEHIITVKQELKDEQERHKTSLENAYKAIGQEKEAVEHKYTLVLEKERLIAHKEKAIQEQLQTIEKLTAEQDKRQMQLVKLANKLRKYEDRRK